MSPALRWWAWALLQSWRAQRRGLRRFSVVFALTLAAALPACAFFANQVASTPRTPTARTALPSPQPSTTANTSPSPSPTVEGPSPPVRSGGYQPGAFQVAHASTGCAAVPPAPSLAASYFPRVVVPREHINVELHEGDGNSPPENVWVAWHYPGTSEPGNAGNSYVYGHAHGNPPDSAPGLFWNLHYVHNCDAVYVYSSPSAAIRYQVSYVNLSWPARNTTVFNPTPDERVTLQTCNGWGNEDPKVIVIAERFIDPPPPPPPSPPPSSSAGASSPDGTMGTGGATPKPSPYGLPCPIITCSGETRIRST